MENWVMTAEQMIKDLRQSPGGGQEADALFGRFIGLHSAERMRVVRGPTFLDIIALQRDKIQGLSLQMAQMKRGYERKIRRLEKKLQEAGLTAPPVDTPPA